MYDITCEMYALCHATATGLISNPVIGVVASCDQHGHLTRVPPAAQYRAYTVPGVGEVTVMIGAAFERPDQGDDVSLFRMYLPNGVGVQGDNWLTSAGGDPDGEGSAWRLMSTIYASMGEADDPAVSGPAKLVAEYAGTEVERIETEHAARMVALQKAAPVGTVVMIEPHGEDGWVRLYVESGENGEIKVDHITNRVAVLLGAEYCPDRDAVKSDGPTLVSRLGLLLHGATGSLFPGPKGTAEQRDRMLSRYLD